MECQSKKSKQIKKQVKKHSCSEEKSENSENEPDTKVVKVKSKKQKKDTRKKGKTNINMKFPVSLVMIVTVKVCQANAVEWMMVTALQKRKSVYFVCTRSQALKT